MTRIASPTSLRLAVCFAIGFAATTLTSCSYQTTSVHNADVDQLRASPPGRTALIGLFVRTNYTYPTEETGKEDQLRSFEFHLDASQPYNPYESAPDWARERFIIPATRTDAFTSSSDGRKAVTLLEAYCTARNDLEPVRFFEQEPTGFGRKRFIEQRNAIVDTLAMVAHAYIAESLEEYLSDSSNLLGELVPLDDAVTRLLGGGDPTLYDRLVATIQREGVLDRPDRIAACELLGVDALLFVASSYDYVSILHTCQYGSWINSAIRVETDAAVFDRDHDEPVATVGFNRVHEEHLKGLHDVGKLVKEGLTGKLADDIRVPRSHLGM